MIEGHMNNGGGIGSSSIGNVFSYDFVNHDTYGKLVRYISSIEHGMYRALHELQRLQAEWNGQQVPLPAVIDLEMGQD